MSFHSSENIDNTNAVSLLLQILEDADEQELYPTFYMFIPPEKDLSLEYLVALSQGLTHARHKVDSVIEIIQNG